MWIVRLALRRPYTFTVMALAIIILGVLSALRMPKDIFPSIDIPVVSVVWQYAGLAPEEMEKRIVTLSERSMTTTVNDIEHMESSSLLGIGVIKIFFHPGTSIDAAVAQVTAISQSVVKQMPPGTTPPLVIRYSATNVPILQLGVSSRTISEQSLFDYALNSVRLQLATVQGAQMPLPSGGKVRQIEIDLDPRALEANGLTPAQVSAAVNAQNLTLPSGTVKVGDREYGVLINNSPTLVEDLGRLPIAQVRGATVYVRDVAQVRDGFAPQTNIVRQNGRRGVLITITKNGEASTLDIIRRIREALPRVESTLPADLQLVPQFDQSIFVRAALNGVIREAVLAALLTAAMILLFLGTWRNTLVVALSIPLSILCSITCLAALGQTVNAMTLGGLALAVGILVDDATVTIENIERNLSMRKTLIVAILDGAQQIAVPAFVSTLCICIVFVPIFFLTGVAKYLFTPLALAVIFAMLASYLLSRTVVPTFVHYLLGGHDASQAQTRAHDGGGGGFFLGIHRRFIGGYERFRDRYMRALELVPGSSVDCGRGDARRRRAHRRCRAVSRGGFLPLVDAGSFRLHVRAPAGMRIEETERVFSRVDDVIRTCIPPDELANIVDNIGLPNSGLNLANSDLATVGTADGDILVSLNPEKHGSTWAYVRLIRSRLAHDFPDCQFFTQPADIVGQILNFGLPAPIDIQISGRDRAAITRSRRSCSPPDCRDSRRHRRARAPGRQRALVPGDGRPHEGRGTRAHQANVANNLLISLSGSGQSAPNYWLEPRQRRPVPRLRADAPVQDRLYCRASRHADRLSFPGPAPRRCPQHVATVNRTSSASIVSHYNVQPVFDVYANVDGTNLGAVAKAVRKLLPEFQEELPRGSYIQCGARSRA